MRALVCSLLLACACSPSPPRAHDSIRFEHGPHLKAGVQCTECHAVLTNSAASTLRGQVALPREAQCKGCHDGPQDSQCRYCHSHPESAGSYRLSRSHLVFDHQLHAEHGLQSCVRCHGTDAHDASVASFEPRTPEMATCTDSCHASEMRELACAKCHRDLHRYGKDALELVRHGPGFLDTHGTLARADDALCASCHEPTFCSECHTGSPAFPMELLHAGEIGRQLIHAADFRARHAAEARLDQASCMHCHGVEFCDGCHRVAGVGGSVGGLSPHPPGWLDALSPRGHAREARRNILSCAGCHNADAERTCVPCHRVGSLARNPHPPGFGAGFDPETQGVCRVCHAGAR